MNCNACGYLGRNGGSFCYSCGKPLVGQEPEPPSLIEAAPGTVTWRGGQVALGILLIVVCIFLSAGIAILMGKLADRFELAVRVWGSSHLMGLAILIVVWGLGLHPRRLSLSSMGLVAPATWWPLTVLFAVLALGGSLAFTWGYANLVDVLELHERWSPPKTPDEVVFPGLAALATYEALAIWTPMTEEIFFRGFVFTGLVPWLGIPRAIVVSALIFSAFHLFLGVLIPIFVTGILLAWLYHRTGSLWPGIAAHAAQNTLVVSYVIYRG